MMSFPLNFQENGFKYEHMSMTGKYVLYVLRQAGSNIKKSFEIFEIQSAGDLILNRRFCLTNKQGSHAEEEQEAFDYFIQLVKSNITHGKA